MSRPLIQATVEQCATDAQLWTVTARGKFENDPLNEQQEIYTVAAVTEDEAAWEGIRRMTAQMERDGSTEQG